MTTKEKRWKKVCDWHARGSRARSLDPSLRSLRPPPIDHDAVSSLPRGSLYFQLRLVIFSPASSPTPKLSMT